MKYLVTFLFLINLLPIIAQERYIDEVFEVNDPLTRTYASKDGEELKLDIYQPVNDNLQNRPLIVFMHGGGFSGGTRNNESIVKFAQVAARKGYVAVSISYRLTRKGKPYNCDFSASGKIETFKEAAEDFLDAVRFLVDHKDEYQIDSESIIVGGSSAGAEAVLSAVYSPYHIFDDFTKYQDIKFSGVFSLAGAMVDARYILEDNAVPGIFFHGTADKVVPYDSAPHHYCEKDKPGYIILDGSKSITDRLEQLGASYVLYSVEGEGHGISRMPFEDFPEVFKYFDQIFLNDHHIQAKILKKP